MKNDNRINKKRNTIIPAQTTSYYLGKYVLSKTGTNPHLLEQSISKRAITQIVRYRDGAGVIRCRVLL